MEPFVLMLVLAGLVSMDTTAGPQVLISEPIVSCTITGWLFGDLTLGVAFGVLFQMLWIGYLPLGAVRFTDNNMGSLVATSAVLGSQQWVELNDTIVCPCIIPAMLYGIIVSTAGMHVRDLVRRLNGVRTDRFIEALENGNTVSVGRVHLACVLTSFFKGVAIAAVFVPLGMLLIYGISVIPPFLNDALADGTQYIIGAAAASAFLFYWKRKRYALMSLGAAGGLVWTLMTTG